MNLKIDSSIKLNNGIQMPRLGFGVYQIPDGKPTIDAISWALKTGYRHIDTAKFYKNEKSVGEAIKASGIPRNKIWVTTKLWPVDFMRAEKAFQTSLDKLGLDYIDLYLIHFPIPGTTKKIWKKLESIYSSGLVRAIGVSNYSVDNLRDTLEIASIKPSVNQIKCSVFGYDKKVYDFCQKNNIAFEAYSPLTRGKKLDDHSISKMVNKYNKSPAQILLRWALQKDMIIIPKSQHRARIIENADIYDFTISLDDMQRLDILSD